MFYVYALSSQTRNYIYVGFTSNNSGRVNAHNKGYEKTTKPYRPFKLIYQEYCETRKAARIREKYFKSGVGKEFLRTLQ